MAEIGPVIAERWDHDAAETGQQPTRLALRVKIVMYEYMDLFLGELHPDATVVSITPVDAGLAQVVYREPHEAPRVATTVDRPQPLFWIADGDEWFAESQGVKLTVFRSWDRRWQWIIDPDGPHAWNGTADYATREIAQQRAEANLPEWLGRYGAKQDDGFAALEWTTNRYGVARASVGPDALVAVARPASIPFWRWFVESGHFEVCGYARTEDAAKRRAYDAWRAYEALRAEVGGDG